MSEISRALVYRGAARGRRSAARPAAAEVAGVRVGVWDLSLILGDLPAVVEKATTHLFTVTAPVPVGIVAPGPCLMEKRLLPHALRVARGLRLDWLIALTPYRLSTADRQVCIDGPVAIVSIAPQLTGRLSARRALISALNALPPSLVAVLEPRLERVGSRRSR